MSEKTKAYWAARARNLVKGEMARRGMSYDDLAVKLKQINVDDTPQNLCNKINRGSFSASFMLQVLRALDCKSLDIHVE